MILKLKSTINELWKCWKLAWYDHFTHIACAKKLRGLQKKLDAFRVHNDNLFRSITVSDENSCVTKGFHFLNLFQLQTFCAFNMHHSKPHHQFWTLFDFIWYFLAFTHFFELNDPDIEKHYKRTLKRLKVGIVS